MLVEWTLQPLLEVYQNACQGPWTRQHVDQTGSWQGFCWIHCIRIVSRVKELCRNYHLFHVLTFIDYETVWKCWKDCKPISRRTRREPMLHMNSLSLCLIENVLIHLFHRPVTISIRKVVRQGGIRTLELLTVALRWLMNSFGRDEKGIFIGWWNIFIKPSFPRRRRHFLGKYGRSRDDDQWVQQRGNKTGLRINRRKT